MRTITESKPWTAPIGRADSRVLDPPVEGHPQRREEALSHQAGKAAALQYDASSSRDGLRVLHVYKDVFPPVVGGIEKQIDMLRRAMPDVVSNVVVGARERHTRSSEVCGGLEVRVAELGPRWLSVPVAPTLPLWVARVDADVIHLHMPNPNGELATLSAGRGRPLVVSYHADVVRQARFDSFYRPFVDACLDRAVTIIAGSHRLVETSPRLRHRAAKVRVIRHAVDVERYDPEAVAAERRAQIRERYGGGPLVVALGRLVYYKGYEHLIEAARTLDAQVLIVGDGPAREQLYAQARGVSNVHFAGVVSEGDLPAYLAAGDCFALPSTSRAESFGIAAAEAQAMGLPAAVTDTGTGTVEAVEDGVTGMIVPPSDPRALREALAALLADPARRQAMGKAARARAVAQHALHDRAGEFRQLYEEVARRSNGR